MNKCFLIMILISTCINLSSEAKAQSDTTIYNFENPTDAVSSFIGNYRKFLVKNLQYPGEAHSKGQQGDVYLRFVIEKDSTVSQLQAEGIYPSLNAEALRIIALTDKKWLPGMKEGVPVRTRKSLKIIFRMN